MSMVFGGVAFEAHTHTEPRQHVHECAWTCAKQSASRHPCTAPKLALDSGATGVTHLAGYSIDSLADHGDQLVVELRPTKAGGGGRGALTLSVDRVVANVGWRPDASLYSELHVHQCWASDGPIKLAASLFAAGGGGGDCLVQAVPGPELLLTPEPGFLMLGMKSYGRNSMFILKIGFEQVEQAVGLLFPPQPAPGDP